MPRTMFVYNMLSNMACSDWSADFVVFFQVLNHLEMTMLPCRKMSKTVIV